MSYVVVYFDGGNGACLGGHTTKEEIEKHVGPVSELSRNDDGLLELDEEGSTFAVPVDTDLEYEWDDEDDEDDD